MQLPYHMQGGDGGGTGDGGGGGDRGGLGGGGKGGGGGCAGMVALTNSLPLSPVCAPVTPCTPARHAAQSGAHHKRQGGRRTGSNPTACMLSTIGSVNEDEAVRAEVIVEYMATDALAGTATVKVICEPKVYPHVKYEMDCKAFAFDGGL